ncbi:MAG: hypothetical protein Q4A19_04385 [Johnsonella sp.]|nr:hypothetical protein [Johnsonella sp.]
MGMTNGNEAEGWNETTIASTREETDKKCRNCGGVLSFDPQSGGLLCPFCGNREEIRPEHEDFQAEELDFNEAKEDQAACDWGLSTKAVICKSCGAETVYDANKISGECPYCGSNQVMEAADSQVMAPGGVVLFKHDAASAAALFKSWLSKKFFCPKAAKENAKTEAFQGLYIPFWTFDTDTLSDYRGEYGIRREYKDKEGETKTKTDWYSTRGRYEESFDDQLVSGSSQQNAGMLSALEPFDTSKAVEYKPEYMAGFAAERYSVKLKEAWQKAKQKISSILNRNVSDKIRREKHADDVRDVHLNTEFANITYKYLLLPVWISSFKYNDKVYQFMVNGQTGKVSGNTPISWIKVALVVLAVAAVIGIIVALTGGDADAAAALYQNASLI